MATKTIESSLWDAHDGNAPDNPHRAEGSPFLTRGQVSSRLDEVLRTELFTVVRNPYSRFLSAYMNKVEKDGAWRKLGGRFGFAPPTVPSMSALLERLAEMVPADLDPHFRPQHLNVLHGVAPLQFVGHLEDMSTVERYLAGHGIALRGEARSVASTGASALVGERLDDTTRALVRQIYSRDFAAFGYSEDWRESGPARNVVEGGSTSLLLAALNATPHEGSERGPHADRAR